jgi:hypothetical protein
MSDVYILFQNDRVIQVFQDKSDANKTLGNLVEDFKLKLSKLTDEYEVGCNYHGYRVEAHEVVLLP